jgi:hypothetical protein
METDQELGKCATLPQPFLGQSRTASAKNVGRQSKEGLDCDTRRGVLSKRVLLLLVQVLEDNLTDNIQRFPTCNQGRQ